MPGLAGKLEKVCRRAPAFAGPRGYEHLSIIRLQQGETPELFLGTVNCTGTPPLSNPGPDVRPSSSTLLRWKYTFTAVGGFDKSIPLAGNKFRHIAMVFRFMQLDLAAHFARGIRDLALCHSECILDRDHDVLVFGRIAVSLADEDILMLRHRDANIDLEQIAVPALHRRCDDRHVTAGDPVMEFFQSLGLFFNF